MNIGESGAMRKFRCCDAARRRMHSGSKERLTSRYCRPIAGRNALNVDTKPREITDLLRKLSGPVTAAIGVIPVILKASGLACEPKSGMRESHGPALIKYEYIFIVSRAGPDLERGEDRSAIPPREPLHRHAGRPAALPGQPIGHSCSMPPEIDCVAHSLNV